MKNKTPKKPVGSILHLSELVPVTDPAEFAELERRVRAAEKAIAARESAPRKRPARKAK